MVVSVGSTDGLTLGQDRLAVIEGQRAGPHRAGEIMMTSGAAKLLNAHVGQLVPLGFSAAGRRLAGRASAPRGCPRASWFAPAWSGSSR